FKYAKKQYQAKRQCETDGAHLVTISSRLENKFITRLTNNIRTWIGGERDDLASSTLIRSSGDDTYSYPLLRLSNGVGSFGFSVDAESDVHILLSPVREPDVHTPLYEIAIGQYGSRTNSIRRCMACESLVEDTTTFLMAGVDKCFIVNFHDGLIQVTQHLGSHVIMEYSDLQPINVHYVSFKTNGQPGTFTLFDNQFKWISGEKWTFDNYHFGETNNKRNTEDCLEINFKSPGLWNDHFCKMRKPFVCETDPETI
ncbi:lectin-like protein, partial [Salmonella sp. s55004]|uniref:lectin-like protein n=1 Tax=Salmonella sp. s55004 TaxID=3159675 RepID=UPI00398153DC